MIQELLGGGAGSALLGERKISINGAHHHHHHHHHVFQTSSPSLSPSPCPPSTTTTTTTTATTSATTSSTTTTTNSPSSTNSENQNNNNLRCPRCDSSNTKFCYYNNYNLTQPRHFCKTCRRYWTKGGALRNVPIGGGCRKNKNTIVTTSVGKSSAGKLMKTVSSEIGRTGSSCFGSGGFEHELPSNNPILWGSSPQSSHLLALLRATTTTTNQNPNPNPSPISNNSLISHHHVKEEMGSMNIGSHMMSNSTEPTGNGALNGRAQLGLDHLDHHQVPSLGLSSSLWRNSNHQNQAQPPNGGAVLGGHHHDAQNSGMQELYQRLIRSSTTNYFNDHSSPLVLNNVVGSTSSSSILESAPVVGGGSELGYGAWNPPAFSWSDLPTTNGAYP